ncbi:MAG: phosphatidate cytidylyltransferase [Alphaproteobacteria bacterium]|nr:phosphatidate cytidylyltransferase [Alphaproteobacteria bacterium]
MSDPAAAPSGPSNLRLRVQSALVMLVVAGICVWAGGLLFDLLVIGVVGVMLLEYNTITAPGAARDGTPGKPFALVAAPIALALILAAFGWAVAALLILVVVAVPVSLFLAPMQDRAPFWALLAPLYVGVPAVALIWLSQQENGLAWILWLIGVVVATDIGGYAAGRTIGGPKLSPRISPKKTWAGLLGGVVGAGIVGLLCASALDIGAGSLMLLSAALAVWEQIGDLFESSIKRRFGVKDSGSIIPGHGGVLDRADGLLFVAPVVALIALAVA